MIPNLSRTVQMPIEFFRKERTSVYSQWHVAFWRELFQNSIDAGAKNISIKMDSEDDHVRVIFKDDGCGMDLRILEDVYFKLGASTKDEDDGAVGGFGRARILTCFSMENYEIITQDWRVYGRGPNFEIEEHGGETQKGCVLNILVDNTRLATMLNSLKRYMEMSRNTKVSCQLNGDNLPWGNVKKGKLVSYIRLDNSSPQIPVYKTTDVQDKLLVWVNGSCMYDMSVDFAQKGSSLIMDIPPEISRTVMTASRDTLRSNWMVALNSALETYRREWMRPYSVNRTARYKGSGPRTFKSERGSSTRLSEREFEPSFTENLLKEQARNMMVTGETEKDTISVSHLLPDLTMYIDMDRNDRYGDLEDWLPENWKIRIVNDEIIWDNLTHKEHFDFLCAWATAVELAHITMDRASLDQLDFEWVPGFVFNEKLEGLCIHDFYEPIDILINPLSIAIRNTPIEHMAHRLVTVALHESAHVKVMNHNEAYANLLTEMMYYCNFAKANRVVASMLREAFNEPSDASE